MRQAFQAGPDDNDRRLETVVRRLCPQLSLGGVHKALRQGDVRLNGAKAGPETRVASGDTIAVWDALLGPGRTPEAAAPIPHEWLLYEGDHLLVVNKPSGLLVHRGEEESDSAPLDERVRASLSPSESLGFRPGPLHRLDRDTSGIVVFSRTLVGARTFSQALAGRKVRKTYLAVLRGALRTATEANSPISRDSAARISSADPEGNAANTRFHPLAESPGLTLVEVDLGSGRTHQIRVHAQSIGYPLAGDTKYGGGPTPFGLDAPWLLHAWKLSCGLLPDLTAPLPAARLSWLQKTFKISV